MIDYQITGCSWISVKPGHYQFASKPVSSCQIEIDLGPEDFEVHAPDGEWSKVAPFRILSFGNYCLLHLVL